MLTAEDYLPKHTDITTKLKRKLFTKVIREPSKEARVSLDTKSNWYRRVIDKI